MKKIIIVTLALIMSAAAYSQTVVTQNLRGKKTKVHVTKGGQAFLWYASLVDAKKYYATRPPANGFIIVTKWYNFWQYNADKKRWKQIPKK